MCRLCGNKSGISINIFDKKESHVRKINAVLPIMVHEMDLLPKHMCHRCSYKLEEFHKFYIDCLKTDAHLKSQLSWMRKEEEESKERIGIPMVHIENVKIKVEPIDYDAYELDPIVENVDYINAMSSMTFPVNTSRTNGIREEIAYTTYCPCYCDKNEQRNRSISNEYQKPNLCNINTRKDNETRTIPNSMDNIVKKDLLERLGHENTKGNINDTKVVSRENKINSNRHIKSNILTNPLTRILRPRKNSVDYVGTKKKSHHAARSRNANTKMADVHSTTCSSSSETNMATTIIKIEKEEKFEGRSLRPRKGTIDYIGRKKRKISENISKDRNNKRRKIDRKISLDTKVKIKTEPLENLENIVLNNLDDSKTQNRSVKDLNANMDALPNTVLPKFTCRNRIEFKNKSHLSKRLQSISRITKNEKKCSKSTKTTFVRRVPSVNYPLKYLRSHGFYLRSGKVKKFTDVDTQINGMRRNNARQHVNARNSTEKITRNLLNVINCTFSSTKVPASIKTIGNNIKLYCERCNISFVNKELFKLHGCYA